MRYQQYSLLVMGIDVDLSAPIDVYSDWIDAAEAVERAGAKTSGAGGDDDYEDEAAEE